MRTLSLMFNVVLFLCCVGLFYQNYQLRSDLEFLKTQKSNSETASAQDSDKDRLNLTARKRKGKGTESSIDMADSEADVHSQDQLEQHIQDLVEAQIEERVKERVQEEVETVLERHHQSRVNHRENMMEQEQNRMTEALYEHLENEDWDGEISEQVEEIILDGIEHRRDIHAQLASGELQHFEARAQMHDHHKEQHEELLELIGKEDTRDLMDHLVEARHSGEENRR
ncbi:MAG: hypothetical protein CMK59_10680 [Proteobacteria bacterium]|nr:hypothetical protein [Pseudomonadota bacterium]